ncbi:MAG: LamG-like jellyroll fold domain-containing protein, partial [Saprospiraceae bacterium]
PGAPYAGAHPCLVTFWFNDTHKYPTDGGQYHQGFYNMALDASDSDADAFMVGFLNLFKSEDAGATFTQWGGYGGGPGWQHPDIQDIDIVNDEIWVSSDGGLNKYTTDFSAHVAMNNGIAASDYWGFDSGWNEDVLTGGRYHNGNSATILGVYPSGQYIRLGGAEDPTGYVHPSGGRKVMHSDISPKVLPTTVSGATSSFSYNTYPNQGYAGNNENSSELVSDPRCYNHLYLGSENKLLKSEDGGISWTTLSTFGSTTTDFVTGIEISRSNPDVIYLIHRDSPAQLYRSSEGGQNFTATNLPSGATSNGAFITMSATDENKIWLAWSVGNNNSNKIFESSDGGNSWTNLTTSTLNGHFVEQLVHIAGTNGGLYLATNFGVFYRNDTDADWVPCSDNLPIRAKINRFVPFYRDSKVRIATYHRGLWEAEMEDTPTTIVQPTVDKLEAFCDRDTFYFDDYSVLNHAGASWAWSFSPAPQYVDNVNIRNPKVVFGNPGAYTATLTVNGSTSETLAVNVTAGCSADTIPGNAISLDPSGFGSANGNLNLNSNTVTFTCWIKAAETQNERAALMFLRGGSTTSGLGFSTGRNLSYHWDSGQWWWDSGLEVPADTWTHVALVVSPTEAKIYLNGESSTNTATHEAEAFDTPLILGYDSNSTTRRFTGLMDEVTVWKKALSQNEIRELMHLTLLPDEQPDLVTYYQMNETTGQVLDRVASKHLSLSGTASRSTSSGPFGGGHSFRQTVNAGGTYEFSNTGLTLDFPDSGTYPDGELCVTRINQSPDVVPADEEHNNVYWIINNFGTNQSFSNLDFIEFGNYGMPGTATPNIFQMYKRSSFADGATWPSAEDTADEVVAGSQGAVKFSTDNGITSFSQFVVTSNIALPVEWKSFSVVLQGDKTVDLHWSVFQTEDVSHFEIERSADGSRFEKMGTVSAKEGSGDFAYKAMDASPLRGKSYYRLKQFDIDGTISYSILRSITIDALPEEWIVYPNPLPENATLEIRTSAAEKYRLLLYSTKGKVVYIADLQGDATISDLNLPAGVYAYQIIMEGGKRVGRLVVGL